MNRSDQPEKPHAFGYFNLLSGVTNTFSFFFYKKKSEKNPANYFRAENLFRPHKRQSKFFVVFHLLKGDFPDSTNDQNTNKSNQWIIPIVQYSGVSLFSKPELQLFMSDGFCYQNNY